MELFDYLRLRWKVLVPLFVVGAVVIVLLGRASGGTNYVASAQMLVIPPSDQLSIYGGDADRYIATEMRLMLQPTVVNAAAKAANVSAADVARSLSYNHDSGSDFVTLKVTNRSGPHAVGIANAVAKAYLSNAKVRALAPYDAQQAALQSKIDEVSKALRVVNTKIQDETTAFDEANDNRINASSGTFIVDQTRSGLLLGQLQSLRQQQQDAELTGAPQIRSSFLREASGATQPAGWGAATYLAGFAGWFLVILAAVGVIVALSRRLLGPARWQGVAAGLPLRRAVHLLRGPSTSRKAGLDRLAQTVGGTPEEPARALVAFMPARSKALSAAVSTVHSRLAQEGGEPDLEEVESVDAVGDAGSTPVLLMIDVARCPIDEAESLGDLPESVQRRLVPVLV